MANKDVDWQSELEREDARWENNKEHTKLLNEVPRCLNSLETIIKLLTEVEKDQRAKME
jgi:hypothetical protein